MSAAIWTASMLPVSSPGSGTPLACAAFSIAAPPSAEPSTTPCQKSSSCGYSSPACWRSPIASKYPPANVTLSMGKAISGIETDPRPMVPEPTEPVGLM